MDLFWLLLIAIMLSLIGGFCIFLTFMWVMAFIRDLFKEKRKIPKDEKKVSEYIRANGEYFRFTPHFDLKINAEEVINNDRREREKFREFEKLRRVAATSESSNGKGSSHSSVSRNAELQRRQVLEVHSDSSDSRPKRKFKFEY